MLARGQKYSKIGVQCCKFGEFSRESCMKTLSLFHSREQTLASFHKKCEGKVMQIAVESDCKSPWEKEKRSRDAFTILTRFKRLPADGQTKGRALVE